MFKTSIILKEYVLPDHEVVVLFFMTNFKSGSNS